MISGLITQIIVLFPILPPDAIPCLYHEPESISYLSCYLAEKLIGNILSTMVASMQSQTCSYVPRMGEAAEDLPTATLPRLPRAGHTVTPSLRQFTLEMLYSAFSIP